MPTLTQESLFLLDKAIDRPSRFSALQPQVASSVDALRSLVSQATPDSLWVSYQRDLTQALVQLRPMASPSLGSAVFIHKMDSQILPALMGCFKSIAFTMNDGCFLRPKELAGVLDADNQSDLLIGGSVDQHSRTVTLWRGDLRPLTVPFSAFPVSGDGVAPDFGAFSVTDYGQTVRFGDYEAATDALLYEFDPKYRRQVGRYRRATEKSFGASLRRLRKQRGLGRNDFPNVSDKTIARIEQGTVQPNRIQARTLHAIAGRLKVEPSEIESY